MFVTANITEEIKYTNINEAVQTVSISEYSAFCFFRRTARTELITAAAHNDIIFKIQTPA